MIIHFWALEAEQGSYSTKSSSESSYPDSKQYLQSAFEQTKDAVGEWLGTTTASGALIHSTPSAASRPVLHVTQLGDSQILVIRPRNKEIIFKTQEQYHWFACPRQLGTNSPDTPDEHAVLDKVVIEENDIVLAMTDGVSDNLWEHEVVDSVIQSLRDAETLYDDQDDLFAKEMKHVATELVKAAMLVAQDPDAQCPYMERALDEGKLITRVQKNSTHAKSIKVYQLLEVNLTTLASWRQSVVPAETCTLSFEYPSRSNELTTATSQSS